MLTPRSSPITCEKFRKWSWSPSPSSNGHPPVPLQGSYWTPRPTCSLASLSPSFHCSCQTMQVSWHPQWFKCWGNGIVLTGFSAGLFHHPLNSMTLTESVTYTSIGKKTDCTVSFCQHDYGAPRRLRDVSKIEWVGKIMGRETHEWP